LPPGPSLPPGPILPPGPSLPPGPMGLRRVEETDQVEKNFSWGNVTNLWDCTFCPPGSQANAECVDGKRNETTNEIVKTNCATIKNPTNDCRQNYKLQCCICGGGVQNYYPPAQASCTT
jgi:hypothetical protein